MNNYKERYRSEHYLLKVRSLEAPISPGIRSMQNRVSGSIRPIRLSDRQAHGIGPKLLAPTAIRP